MSESKISLAQSVAGSQYILHYSETTWGDSILIMEKSGLSFGRVCWYSHDYTTVYLDSLSVSKEVRRKRLGTEMQEIREGIGRILGASSSMLSVVKDSWMHQWYIRRGYIYHSQHEDSDLIWMIKIIK